MSVQSRPLQFPKSLRLLKKSDFSFRQYRRYRGELFKIIYSATENPSGRLGISISKKVLKKAVWRNRVRRLLKESFRLNQERFQNLDIHVIAEPKLFEAWQSLEKRDMENELEKFLKTARGNR
jgi:ribonuclease P protein component